MMSRSSAGDAFSRLHNYVHGVISMMKNILVVLIMIMINFGVLPKVNYLVYSTNNQKPYLILHTHVIYILFKIVNNVCEYDYQSEIEDYDDEEDLTNSINEIDPFTFIAKKNTFSFSL